MSTPPITDSSRENFKFLESPRNHETPNQPRYIPLHALRGGLYTPPLALRRGELFEELNFLERKFIDLQKEFNVVQWEKLKNSINNIFLEIRNLNDPIRHISQSTFWPLEKKATLLKFEIENFFSTL